MKNADFRKILFFFALTTVGYIALAAKYMNLDFGLNYDTFSAVGTITSINWVIWIAFKKWLWAIPIFQGWLVCVPNLRGEWTGTIESTWKDPETDESPVPIETQGRISQTLNRITLDFETGEMTSRSITADITCDAHRKSVEVDYIYLSEPGASYKHRSQIHYGAARLSLTGKGSSRKLKGTYWTDRKTTGTLALTKSKRS